MMPAPAFFVSTEALRPELAGQAITLSDSVNYALLVTAMLVAIGVAVWQYLVLKGYHEQDRLREAEQAAQRAEENERERLRRERLARRESWEEEFRETQATLNAAEDFESEVRRQGPLDHDAVERAELGKIQWRLENASRRCPPALKDPLNEVAAAVARLRSITVLSDTDVGQAVTEATTSAPAREPAPQYQASAIGAKAVEQYQAAVDLHEAIGRALRVIHVERGGGS
jgi:hypothetical protein